MSLRTRCVVPFMVSLLLAGAAAFTATSDPQAVALLNQSLSAAGGVQALAAIRDFAATGTITYYWAGQQVAGTATVRARGFDQFRLDSIIPDGTRSYAVSHGVGSLKDTSGAVTSIPYFNTVNIGLLSFPYLGISARLGDPLSTISDMGLVSTSSGSQLHQVRVQRGFPPGQDPNGALAAFCVTDYFLDPQTSLVMEVVDQTHAVGNPAESYAHEIDLGNYTAVNGVSVPMTLGESVDGQMIWQLQLSSVSFNVGLTDADFVLQ